MCVCRCGCSCSCSCDWLIVCSNCHFVEFKSELVVEKSGWRRGGRLPVENSLALNFLSLCIFFFFIFYFIFFFSFPFLFYSSIDIINNLQSTINYCLSHLFVYLANFALFPPLLPVCGFYFRLLLITIAYSSLFFFTYSFNVREKGRGKRREKEELTN